MILAKSLESKCLKCAKVPKVKVLCLLDKKNERNIIHIQNEKLYKRMERSDSTTLGTLAHFRHSYFSVREENERRMNIRTGRLLWWGGLLLLFSVMATGIAYSGEMALSEESGELEQLEKTVNRLTELATRNHLNADYVPGMVTVLYGRDLEDRGIRSAGEALNLVPGMNLSHTGQIYWKTVARGVPKPLAAGHIKLLLNGTPLTTTFGIDLVPNIPIEQVDRIEIVRGPASEIHGEHAVTGVVNIITLEKGKRVFGAAGSYGTYLGGGLLSLEFPESDLKMSLNISGGRSEGTDAAVGMFAVEGSSDPTTTKSDFLSMDDGFGGSRRDSRTGLFSLQWRETSLTTSFLEQDRKGWYKTRQFVASARQRLFLTSSLAAETELSFLKRKFDSDAESTLSFPPEDSPDGWIYEFDYNEKKVRAGLDLVWDFKERLRSLLGYSFTQSELSDVERIHYPDETYKGDDRRINSLRLQEEWRPHDRIMLTGGVRYDHYDDIGERVSPTFASVFRLNGQQGAHRQHILKAQYGRTFRPPTFLESRFTGNGLDTEFETIDTYEFGYITRKFDETFRATAFHSDITQRIDVVSDTLERYRVNGLELEYARPLIPSRLDLDFNFSYARTENRETGDKIPGSADILTNLGLTLKPVGWLSLSLQLHSAFERNQTPTFGDDVLEDYHLLDCTVRLRHPELQDLTLRLGIKNMFEEDFRFPSERTELGYESDDRPGRFWWLSLSYQF